MWRLTEPAGCDVVLTSSSAHMSELWRNIAPAGRLIQFGSSDPTNLDASPFTRGATYSSINIDALYLQNPKLLSRYLSPVMYLVPSLILTHHYRVWKDAYLCCSPLLAQSIHDSTDKLNVFHMSAIAEALRSYSGNLWDKKHIISYKQAESIPVSLLDLRSVPSREY